MKRFLPLLAASIVVAAPALATDDDLRSVAAMHGHNRVLLVFAPTLADARLETQRAAMARFAADAATRDLLFVQVAQDKVLGARDDAARLRVHYKVSSQAYRTLLLGKDGEVALAEPAPVAEDRLRATIDAMPMRQAEVQRAKAGLGKPAD